MQLQSVNVADKANWYEIRRNELLKLLEKTSQVEIPEKYAREMEAIRKKCLEDQFEIVLVGEFQGGKSTTFNALCDGRDLSPRGLGGGGIKTSAAIISAQNISDGETKDGLEEWAEITFKTKYEIQKGMFELLRDALMEDKTFQASLKMKREEFLSAMSDPSEFARLLDLDSPVHRKAVRDILSLYWSAWSQDKASLDEDTKDRLRIATLQERFYGTPEYKDLLSKTILSVSDFQPLVAFPEDWPIRWKAGKDTSFTWQETAFVFIARVLLRVKSESLAKLGCRITDCPGLFANAYDKSVARKAINNADAVWYLIGGLNQIGEKDLQSLDIIKQTGMIPRVIGSVNLRGKHEQKMRQVFPVTQEILHDHGFSFPLLPYNARLAFLATQGKRCCRGEEFSKYERKCMQIDSDNDADASIELMWIEMVNDAGANTGLKELKGMDDVSMESVQKVLAGSNIEEILSFLSQEIITKKSHFILIENGSKKAADALQEYEGQLKMSEDAARQDKAEWEKKVQENQKALDSFIEKSKEILEDSDLYCERSMLSRNLALDLVKYALDKDFINRASDAIARSVKKYEGELYLTKEDFKEDVVKDVGPTINMLFTNALQRTLESWKTDNLNSAESWDIFKSRLNRVNKNIKSLWKEKIEEKDLDYIKALTFTLPNEEDVVAELTALQDAFFSNESILEVIEDSRFGIGGLFFAILALVPALIIEGISQLFGKSIFDEDEEENSKRLKTIQNKIVQGVTPALQSPDLQTKLSGSYVPEFSKMQNLLIKKIKEALDNLSVCFKADHVDPAKRNLNESERKRKEIAEKNNKIRTQQIEPLRKEIRAYEQQVTTELNQNENA